MSTLPKRIADGETRYDSTKRPDGDSGGLGDVGEGTCN
jgi:hypothetical protein